jgi:ArsR family metal-binding transcriptional regulator
METFMKTRSLRNIVLTFSIGLFPLIGAAQDEARVEALREIAQIVASINHFPSDENKAVLASIEGNESYPQGIRMLAATVANISHAANAEGKQSMTMLQGNQRAPEAVKSLAEIIGRFNHMANDQDKAALLALFP